ncbi:MAG: molybdopterin-guanine dinucleotide biosynthesis protein B [Archaeoglobaceae archaeon]|nr:molybdopterin-guanine dinucleotide biosynthesis protein B [Archaeoglobaceae archaeon]MDW8117401.1 molybdopterin-guanine dinucleotide biosynthesis protein B [Archaeoglobaceae archaeon]
MILSIVGKSNTGKTTLIEKLVPLLIEKGYRVAVVKHAHKGFELDAEGKDSDRVFKAGADVAIVSDSKIAIMQRNGDLKRILEFFKGYDLILTEGFSKESYPKIALDDGDYKNVLFRYKGNFDDLMDFIFKLIKK